MYQIQIKTIFLTISTTSNLTRLIADFSPSQTYVSVGQFVGINAVYTYAGVPIDGASCSVSSSALNPPSQDLSSTYNTDDSLSAYASIANVSGLQTFTVQCNKMGYTTLSYVKTFYVAINPYTLINWVSMPGVQTFGSNAVFSIDFIDTAYNHLSGGNCTLTVDSTNYDMTPLTGSAGRYTYSYLVSTAGQHTYSVSCSTAGYYDASSGGFSFFVSGDGSVTPTTQPALSHCIDQVKNYDETDTDCGGSCTRCAVRKRCQQNSDCQTSYCLSGRCAVPSCSDGIRNGDEIGIDCGGSCSACNCLYNWDCNPDGSEHCTASYQCVQDACSVNCSALLWYSSALGYYSGYRSCINSVCRFSQNNVSNASLSVIVVPKSFLVWNDAGRQVYISNCEDKTNYFTVQTSVATQKWYYHADPGFYSPFVPASNNIAFDSVYELQSSGYIPALCEIPAGSDRVYSLITFQVTNGGNWAQKSIYTLTFRQAFKFTYGINDSKILLNLTRPGTCSYRASETDSWTQLNPSPASLVVWDGDKQPTYFFQCNDSYGESYTLSSVSSSGAVEELIWDTAFNIAGGVFWEVANPLKNILSRRFTWQPEYTIYAVILGLFVLPLLYLMLRGKPRGQQQHEN